MAKKISRDKAILAINPDAIFNLINETADGYESIDWLNDTTPIPAADIEAKLAELQAEEDAKVAQKETDKANAKAKLIAGEPLTEAEADTIVL